MATTVTPSGRRRHALSCARRTRTLLTGEGRSPTTSAIPGHALLAVVRSPYAHARIPSIDASAREGHGRRRRSPAPTSRRVGRARCRARGPSPRT